MAKPQECVENIQIQAFTTAKKICCVIIPQDENHKYSIFGKEHQSDSNPPIFLGHETKDRHHYVALECPKNKEWQEVWKDIETSAATNKNTTASPSPKK